MAHGRYPVSPCHLARNQPTISSIDALNASTGRCLTPTIGIYASRPHLRCTVAASEISIAPADRGARSPAGFLHWRLSNAGPVTLMRGESLVMGPASETRHINGPEQLQQGGGVECFNERERPSSTGIKAGIDA